MSHKLFECTVYILNYDHCYILHPRVSFTVKLDGNMKHMTCICVLLKWHKLKRLKTHSSQSTKKNFKFIFSPFSPSTNQNPCKPKFPNQNHLRHHHYSTTMALLLHHLVFIFFHSYFYNWYHGLFGVLQGWEVCRYGWQLTFFLIPREGLCLPIHENSFNCSTPLTSSNLNYLIIQYRTMFTLQIDGGLRVCTISRTKS